MQEVLTIHGVGIFGGRGPWQTAVDRVLAPHFECTAIKYSHYRWLGLLTAVIEPWLLLPGLVLVVLLHLFHVFGATWPWVVLAVAASLLAARIRHGMCIRNFVREHDRATALGVRPHVIAHSMGTKVVGTVLETYPQVRLTNVIFAGCVLPTDYPWRTLIARNARRFGRVRNEVGGRDMVPELAGLGAKLWLLRGYGAAGSRGFEEVDGLVHTVSALAAYCARCVVRTAAVAIHNVVSPHFGHGGVFDAPGYAAAFWMPFLWGIEPSEYQSFLELCIMAEHHHEQRNWVMCCVAEGELLDRDWSWTGGTTLRDFIEQAAKHYRAQGALAAAPTGQIVRKMWQDVVIASRAHQKRPEGWERAIRSLNPLTAVLGSVDAILS